MLKKSIFILLLVLFPIISAAQIDLGSDFSQGETIIAKISGNFLEPVSDENIFFYRYSSGVEVSIPMNYDVLKINGEFYVYALLENKQPGNYSFRVESVQYMLGTEITDEDIVSNFTITNETVDFSVSPAVIITEDDFLVTVQNLGISKITINFNESLTDDSSSVELLSGEEETLEFNLGEETALRTIKLSSENTEYNILVYSLVEGSTPIKPTPTNNESSSETNNTENNSTSNNDSKNETNSEEEIKPETDETCSDLEGSVCSENQVCEGTQQYTKEGVCCIGICKEKEKSNTGKIIGWGMIVIILISLYWFFKNKYRRAKRDVDLFKMTKGRR